MSRRRDVRDRWQEEVLRTRLIKDSCRVLLLYMATAKDSQGRHLMTEVGYIRRSREQLAAALGLKPQRITDRISEATRAGLLVRVAGGVNGQTAQYAANFPPGPGVASRHPQAGVEVSAEPVPGTGVQVSAEPVPEVPVEAVPQISPGNGKTDTSKPIPQTAPEDAPGIGGADTIRVRATYGSRDNAPAPDGSRAEPDHDGTSEELQSRTPAPPSCSNEGDSEPSRAENTDAPTCRRCGHPLPAGLVLLGRGTHIPGTCPNEMVA
jgi:hypothetical protein